MSWIDFLELEQGRTMISSRIIKPVMRLENEVLEYDLMTTIMDSSRDV